MANAANVHVFHVEFGLNDTVLTRALEDQNYTTAERLILENAHTSFLDEGRSFLVLTCLIRIVCCVN